MKKTLLFLLCLVSATLAFSQPNPNQEKIDAAFIQSFPSQQNQVEPVIVELKKDVSSNAYWIAYGLFYSSIYSLQTKQNDAVVKNIKEAIELLENIKDKSSEEHALLGYLLGFSISFDQANAPKLSAKAKAQYEAALKKDDKNMRAYYGLGESDFRTPAEYGGGKKVEEYLVKAIALPEQSEQNGPSWGKNMTYHTLASFYLREGQKDKAKMYCMQGLAKFPQDYNLNELKKALQSGS
jgi:tetratricopeptide (TPR) repeat protein